MRGKRGEIINIKLKDRLKQALVDEDLVTKDTLEAAEATARWKNEHISSILIESGVLTEEQLARFIVKKLHIPHIDIKTTP